MDHATVLPLISDLLIVLAAGLAAAAVCRWLGASLLVGYLVVGAIVGQGGLRWVESGHELELLAEAGALLLLFAVGIEFSIDQLQRLSRYFTLGGATQMLLVAGPIATLGRLAGLPWNAALLIGAAAALSSTVLVFRALAELGQTSSPHGQRAIGVLLFQDVALVPLLLVVPMLTGQGEPPSIATYVLLGAKSTLFVVGVIVVRWLVATVVVDRLAKMRSVEIVVLFAICLWGGCGWAAHQLGLPAAVGSLAAGIALSGNRLTQQIDSIVLPFRETFAAVFFVTLGMLLQPVAFVHEPLLLAGALVGVLAIKTLAAGGALRLIGLRWRAALGMGLGLAQLGEFSFLLVGEGVAQGVISAELFNRLLFVALGSLILTPLLLRWGLPLTEDGELTATPPRPKSTSGDDTVPRAVVIGLGPIGRQIASRLETDGLEVGLIDYSPVNLYAFAQLGFRTVAGDARDPAILRKAQVAKSRLIVVCVPDDDVAIQVVRSIRELNRQASILVRCRFQIHRSTLTQAGANAVVSEEAEASQRLLEWCEQAALSGDGV